MAQWAQWALLQCSYPQHGTVLRLSAATCTAVAQLDTHAHPSPHLQPAVEVPAAEAPAAVEEPSADAAAKKRPLEEAPQEEAQEPAAKLAKVEPVVAAAPAAPPAPRVRKHMDHPAARAQRRARKAQAAPPEPEVLFPVGESPADVAIPRRLRTATPRRPRSSRAAWGRLKQVRGIGCQGERRLVPCNQPFPLVMPGILHCPAGPPTGCLGCSLRRCRQRTARCRWAPSAARMCSGQAQRRKRSPLPAAARTRRKRRRGEVLHAVLLLGHVLVRGLLAFIRPCFGGPSCSLLDWLPDLPSALPSLQQL